jgi:hypothetical protein
MENMMFAFVEWFDWALPYILSIMIVLGIIASVIGRYFYTEEDWRREVEVDQRLEEKRRRERLGRR